LPASYFEKLFWSFIKNRFFGGVILFLKLDVLPLTIMVPVIIILEYYFKFQPIIVPIYALILMLIGFLTKNIKIRFIYSLVLSLILLGLFIVSYIGFLSYDVSNLLALSAYQIAIYALIFVWLFFNSVMLIIQIAEFFASTVGLYLLWGSDKKRIFLTPLPQLAMLGIIYICLKVYLTDKIAFSLIIIAITIILTLIYFILRNAGRVVRSALAIYLFFEAYIIVGYVYRFQMTQNIIAWLLLTLLATFFTAQGRASIIAKEKKGVNGNIILLIGILLLISHALIPINGNALIQFELWWLLSILATIIAPLGFAVYIVVSSKLRYYIKRDNTPTHVLFLEVAKIVGAKVMTELLKILSSSFTNLAKSFRHSDDR